MSGVIEVEVVTPPDTGVPLIGTPGPTGKAGTIVVAGTVTVPYGTPASVDNEGSETNAALRFTIPAGPDGPPPEIEISVLTGEPGSEAQVHTEQDDQGVYQITLTVPRGHNGLDGGDAQFRATETHLQWRLDEGAWTDLIALEDITGPPVDMSNYYTKTELDDPATGKLDKSAASGFATAAQGALAETAIQRAPAGGPTVYDLPIGQIIMALRVSGDTTPPLGSSRIVGVVQGQNGRYQLLYNNSPANPYWLSGTWVVRGASASSLEAVLMQRVS